MIPIASARTFYVSPDGDDQHHGDENDPLRTISRAAELAMPGDVILVKAGIYRERVSPPRGGEPGKLIIYRGAPGERVIIKGSEIWKPDWRDEGDGVYSAKPSPDLFDDRSDEYVDHHNPFKVELASTPWGRQGRREKERRDAGDKRIGKTDDRIVYTCGQIFVNGSRLREVPLKEELKSNTWLYEPQTERIYVHLGELNPAEQVIEITTRRRIFAPKTRGLGHIVVEGFIFEHAGNQYPTNFWDTDANAQKGAVGIEAGHNWVIRRNVIRHAKTFALDVGRVDRHSAKDSAQDNIVEENYIMDNGSAGILTSGSVNLIIRNNVIVRNNVLGFSGIKRWEQAAIKAHGFRNGLIEGNYLANNHKTYGVWLDNQFPDCRVTRNVIVSNGSAGIFLEMSDYGFDRLLIDHNVVIDNHENAIYIHDASGATFVHNILGKTRDAPGRGQAVFIRQVTTRTRSRNHSFFGNLFIENTRHIDVCYPSGRGGLQRFDRNLYGIDPESRSFTINFKCDIPRPWTEDQFAAQLSEDLSDPSLRTAKYVTGGNANLDLKQWQAFWKRHGLDNDRHSGFDPSASIRFDPAENTLTLSIGVDPQRVGSVSREGVRRDFFGDNLPPDEKAVPGPFQRLKRGENSFKVWDGLPILDEGQLPHAAWTKDLAQ